MDAEDVVTFCQSDLPCISFAAFEAMREKGQFCDVTIKVQNHSIIAHRMILAAAIPYFQLVFSNSDIEMEEKEIAVQDLDLAALESLMHFAYTSKVKICPENVESLLVASQFLQLNQVQDACVKFLSDRLNVNSIIKVRTFANNVSHSNLIENCDVWIRKNFEEFSKCDDFLTLPYSCIKATISDDELNVWSEDDVFDSVIKWVESSTDRHSMLPDLMSEVRMTYLSTNYLVEKVGSVGLITNSIACRNLVDEVIYRRLLPERKSFFSDLETRPRNQWKVKTSDKHFYAIGSSENCFSVHHFDVQNEIWCPLADSQIRYDTVHNVVTVNRVIYMFLDKTIQTFSLKCHKWNVLESTHTGIRGSAIVPYNDTFFCFGAASIDFAKKLRCFNTVRNEWVEERNMNTVRNYSAAAIEEESIYVTGGFDYFYSKKFLNTVEKYIPCSGVWCDVSPMLTPRCCHSCTSVRGRIYACGGRNNCIELNTAEVYDPVTDWWTYLSPMKNKIANFALLSHCGKIYMFEKTTCEVYDPKTDQWKTCSSNVPEGFCGAASIVTYIQQGTL